MLGHDKLNSLIENKKILYIPIYSCFDYQTNKLNFKADGNINRFLTTFYYCNKYKSLDIFCPTTGKDFDWFVKSCETLKNINLIYLDLIAKSAKIERSLDFANNIFKIFNDWDKYDYIIVESQHLFLKLYINGYKKMIYWCPVCATNEKTRDFLEPFRELDKHIFSISEYTIVASNDQVKYYKSITNKNPIQINTFINRNLPFFKYTSQDNIIELLNKFSNYYKIFLPFRLTDKGYQMQEIFDFLYNEFKNTKSFKVFYSNPNNCDIYQFAKNDAYKKLFIDENFIQVSKDRDTYYTIIDFGKVIIPYFEDTDFIWHAAINEFSSKKSSCIIHKNLKEFKSILKQIDVNLLYE